MLKQVLVAVALIATSVAPAAAQAPSEAAEMRAHREFAVWIQRISSLMERAGAANDVFNGLSASFNTETDLDVLMSELRPVRDQARAARALLAQLQGELTQIAPYRLEGAPPQYAIFSETLLEDTGVYMRNMDRVMDLTIQLIDAMDARDFAAVEHLAPRLMQTASTLIDGQIFMVRARQQLIPATQSAHHSLGSILALYEGMRAIVVLNVVDRPAAITAAADAATRWSRTGRAVLAQERPEVDMLAPREREIMMRMIAIQERFFVLGDRVSAHLRLASAAAARGMSDEALNVEYSDELAAFEMEFLRLNQEQIALFAELTEAGREL
jgi:hypothetical protein